MTTESSKEEATYLYAVCRPMAAAALDGLRGIGEQPVRALQEGELACLVSSVSLDEFSEEALPANLNDLGWLERTARAHDAVIRAASDIVTTAPLRMATVCLNDAAARRKLRELSSAAATVLARLDDRVEWGVKLYAQEDVAQPRETAAATSGRDYLQRRRQQTLDRRDAQTAAVDATELVCASLGHMAVATRRHRPQDPQLSGVSAPMLLNGAFLVDRERADEFRETAEQLAAEHPVLRADITGPWPPYSFAALDES